MTTHIAQRLLDPARRPAWRVLLCGLMAVTCWFAFTPHPPELPLSPGDKLQHFTAFTCLTGCCLLGFQAGWRGAALSALGMLAFGGFIEIVQSFIPGRSAEWLDLGADSVGIAIGLVAVGALRALFQPGRTQGPSGNL
jgi:VanZ family protein